MAQTDKKTTLQNQRAQLIAEIQANQKILQEVKKNKSSSFLALQAIDKQLNARKQLINNFQNSVIQIDHSIISSKNEIKTLESKMEILKQDYAKMIRYAYMHRSSLTMISFIFSSDNFNQAMRRIGYMKKYRQIRDNQVAAIHSTQQKLNSQIDYYNTQRISKTRLLDAEQAQEASIEQTRTEKEKLYNDIKLQEKEVIAQINKNKTDAKNLDKQIAQVIKAEIAANAAKEAKEKAERERIARQLSEENKRKIEEAKQARIKAEEEKKRLAAQQQAAENLARQEREQEALRIKKEQEELARIKREQEAKEKSLALAKQQEEKAQQKREERELRKLKAEQEEKEKRMAIAQQQADNARKQREQELAVLKQQQVSNSEKIKQAQALENNVINVPAVASGSSFGSNQGSLRMPVRGSIVGRFGTQPHPVFPNLKIENNGIDIMANKGSPVSSVFEGTVSSIMPTPGGSGSTVLVNHGGYFTVYTNLATVNVGKGSHVNTGQTIGTVGSNDEGQPIINFQIWQVRGDGSVKLNPDSWVR